MTLTTPAKEDKACDIELFLYSAVNTVSNFITCMVIIAWPSTHALELCWVWGQNNWQICFCDDNKWSVTVAENWWNFVLFTNAPRCLFWPQNGRLSALFVFEIEKPYRLEQKVESILFYEINVVYRAFKTRVPFQRLEPDDLAQVAACFQVCLPRTHHLHFVRR